MSLEAAILATALKTQTDVDWAKFTPKVGIATLSTPTTSLQTTFSYSGKGIIKAIILTNDTPTSSGYDNMGFGTIAVDGTTVFQGNYNAYQPGSGWSYSDASGIITPDFILSGWQSDAYSFQMQSAATICGSSRPIANINKFANAYPYSEAIATAVNSLVGVVAVLPEPLYFNSSITVQQQANPVNSSTTTQHNCFYVLGVE